jgi:spore germination protein GerM
LIFAASAVGQQTMKIKLFFHNIKKDPEVLDCRKVFEVERTIPKTIAVATAALNELFKGVNADEKEKGFYTFSAAETKGILKRVGIKNKIAYVNFNAVILQQLGNATTSCGSGYFASIDETLKQFPTVEKVLYAVEGDPAVFYEWIQVGECPEEIKDCSGKDFE